MSSFFTIPGSNKKRKRTAAPEAPKKRIAASKTANNRAPPKAAAAKGKTGAAKGAKSAAPASKKRTERDDDDESISGSDSDDESIVSAGPEESNGSEDDDDEVPGETAAERRLRLAEQYLENVKEQVDLAGFDAAEIDRDLINERLQEDVAESKGKVYRQLADELAFGNATSSFFKNNTETFTSVAVNFPYAYTTTKDLYVHKWRIQDLPKNQFQQTTRKKPKKPPAPPRKRPELQTWLRGNINAARNKSFQRHVEKILCVAASPDGKYVVTGGEDRRLIIYDAETLKPIRVFTHHRDAVTGLAFRRGTNQLYSCSRDRTVKVWSLDELAYIETLFGHQDEIVDIDALAQERCVSVGARDRTARLWKVAEETQLVFRGGAVDKKSRPDVDPRSLPHEGSMDRVAMIDDELFVTGSDNGSLALWGVTKKKPIFILPMAHGLEEPLRPDEISADHNPDSSLVPPPQPRWITALKTIPYSDVILSGSWDGCIRVWRLSEDKRKIEAAGVLTSEAERASKSAPNGKSADVCGLKGVINDIAIFERGDRGQDGVCVVAAVGKEHRLGRWQMKKGKGKNGGYVFEVPRVVKKPEVNGNHNDASDSGSD
ncbi:putative WD repeat-containing protein [Colletotrichum fructicola]|uniref:WD domain-containing protein n=2 Tax=Colletotrichum gloeosporioides species complex TaxID=2707338 RepID=A0A9W4RHG0_9PEZI|nr:putative WD repeat-containing protein [Colletotrichum fructicola]KAF4488446.1 putative WD repeat-containing protein [Colletotrichum fructicola Nara gc5]KAF4824241.1 putative WD repeat-containing protein [Colletotrichum siamense]KAF4837732.1 putative WD repeat-containing protein [Colletotrichum tropicale]KAI8156154.1 putative WD repeat-containing protein [Colletotrichum sp. SAR 10_71]KAI8165870.1 putative WD repeat-containing protein [Colletotrichum sp. SAR 10_70]KAI8214613.1 putative WD re